MIIILMNRKRIVAEIVFNIQVFGMMAVLASQKNNRLSLYSRQLKTLNHQYNKPHKKRLKMKLIMLHATSTIKTLMYHYMGIRST